MKLGELLVKAKVIDESQLKAALVEQKRWGGKLGEILVRMNLLTEDLMVRALSKQLNIQSVNLAAVGKPDAQVLAKIPERQAKELGVVPLQLKDEGRTLVVAMSDPLNMQVLDTLRMVSRCRLQPHIVGPTALARAVARFYGDDQPALEDSAEENFKIVDSQGRTVVGPAPLPPEAKPSERAPNPQAPTSTGGESPGEQLRALEALQRNEVATLKTLVDLLIAKGVFSRNEYAAKVKR
ncbi:MAG: hypothetical protein ACKVPX_15910 [Myxococcaceae bacterium]